MLALGLSVQIILYIMIGFLSRKLKIVGEGFDKSLSAFLVDIALPCMIIHALNMPYSPDELQNCAILLALAFVVSGLLFGIGHFFYLRMGKTGVGRVLRFGTFLSNFTFMGMPMVQALYGQAGLFYLIIFTAPIRVIYYSFVGPLMSPPGAAVQTRSLKTKLKGWINPPIVAAVVGLIFYFTSFTLPDVLNSVVTGLSNVCSPMGMVLCGITLGNYDLKTLLRPRYLRLPLIRTLLSPAVVAALMFILPVDPLMKKMIVIYAALPCAGMLTTYTIQYDPNPEPRLEAAGATLISTLISAATIPLWALFLSYLF